MGHLGVQEGHPVVGEAHSSGPLELRHVHQLLALHPLGHTGGLEDPDPGPLPLLPGAVDGLGAVYGGHRVGHTDDGGVSSPLGGGRAGLHRLLVLQPRIPEMHMQVDKAGHHIAALGIQYLICLFPNLLGHLCNPVLLDQDIHNPIRFRCRINHMSVLD